MTLGAAPAAALARDRPGSPTPPSADFSRYRLDTSASEIYPMAVAEVSKAGGTIDAPEGLLAPGGAATRIVKPQGLGAEPTLLLDFGRNVSGVLEIGLSDSDGTAINAIPAERRAYLPAAPYFGGVGDMQGGASGSDDTSDRAPTLTPNPGASIARSIGVLGAQRWIRLRLGGAGSATIDFVRLHPTHEQPGASGYRGWFLSSDDELNRVWYSSAYTEQLSHLLDPEVIVDGAKRDRLVWTGDLVIGAMTEMLTTARPEALRNSLELLAERQRPDGYIPANVDPHGASQTFDKLTFASYVALWPVALGIYNKFTADNGFVRKQLATMRRALDWLNARAGSDGLLVVTDQEAFNWHPPDVPTGKVADTNADYYGALTAAAALERAVGDGRRAADDEQRAAKLRQSFNTSLWDDRASMYRLSEADANTPQDASADAIFTHLADAPKADRALAAMRRTLWTPLGSATIAVDDDPAMSRYISPFISGIELLDRGERRDVAGGLELIRRTWRHFLSADPASTTWEKLDLNGEPATYNPDGKGNDLFPNQGMFQRGFASLAHAWSTAPVPFLTGYVLGVRARTPGFGRWIVAPQPGGTTWARGVVPTPKGPISTWWRRGPRSFVMSLRTPRGTRGTVTLPAVGAVTVDGRKPRSEKVRAGTTSIRALAPGRTHLIVVRRKAS